MFSPRFNFSCPSTEWKRQIGGQCFRLVDSETRKPVSFQSTKLVKATRGKKPLASRANRKENEETRRGATFVRLSKRYGISFLSRSKPLSTRTRGRREINSFNVRCQLSLLQASLADIGDIKFPGKRTRTRRFRA